MSILSRADFWWWLEWIELFINDKKGRWNLSRKPLSICPHLKKESLDFKKYSRVLFVTEILSVQLTLCEGDDFAPIVCSTRCRIYFRNSFHHLISLWDHLRLLLRPPDTPGHLSPELLIVLPPLLRGVHISGRLVIRIWKLTINN